MSDRPDALSRYRGCLLGHALGDAIGAKYEGGFAERLVWATLGLGRHRLLRTTDDTRMALGLAESLVEHGGLDADALARRWAADLDWRRGYGPGAARLLRLVAHGTPWQKASRSVFPDGSFGNGAAMRAAPLGLFFPAEEQRKVLVEAARLASSITHAHPLGMEGGVLLAVATALALEDDVDLGVLARASQTEEYRERLAVAATLGDASGEDVRRRLGNTIRAHESAPTAVYVFVRFRDRAFPDLMEFVVELGGDTDTIGAMAGGLWGAARGVEALPADLLDRLEDRERIDAAARALHAHVSEQRHARES